MTEKFNWQMQNSCLPHVIGLLVKQMTASCLLSCILPTTIMATVWPPKRRRTEHRLPPMVEGSNSTLDTAMYIHSEGGERILVPLRLDVPVPNVPEPDPVNNHEFHPDPEVEMNNDHREAPSRNRFFYMKEFVARVGGILEALQHREALPDSTICAKCSESIAHWRCNDCIGGKLLCRFCMRHSHSSNLFHRIECWTGSHFRKAALWEVSVYLTLPHQNGAICQNLLWQKQMLEIFQKKKNEVVIHSTEEEFDDSADPAPDPKLEAAHDETEMRFLDQLLAGNNPDEIMEEDDDNLEGDIRDIDAGTAGFTSYMDEQLGDDPNIKLHNSVPNAPNCDALNNQYIRVAHTNGIHHIALVCCTCQGHEQITTDLIYAG